MNRFIFHCDIVWGSIGKCLREVALNEVIEMGEKENMLWTSSSNDLGNLELGPLVTCEIFVGKNFSFPKLLETWSCVNLFSN